MKPRYRGSKDGNHDAIADTLRALGCSVEDLPETGIPGFPDTLVGLAGQTHLAEIKNLDTAYGRRGLTPDQTAFHRDWRGAPIAVLRTTDEAITWIKRIRAGLRA
jgi:hypothetical protein